MIKISTATALGIICGGALLAASSSPGELPLTPVPAQELGPTQIQFEIATPPVGSHPNPSPNPIPEPSARRANDLQKEDFFSKLVVLVPPPPAPSGYYGLISGDESISSILSDPRSPDHPTVSRNRNDNLSALAGVAIYGFGVFAVYRGIRKAGKPAES